MATKITTPELFNLSSNNTAATQLPVFTTSTRPTPTTSTVQVEYLVIGGGGGGGNFDGGGGGAGGYLTNYNGTPISITTSNLYTVTVGEGGVGGQKNVITSGVGDNSIFDTIISYGGGGGASDNNTGPSSDGGSGGGAAGGSNPTIGLASPPGQGYNGGNSSGNAGGGGGGASEAGNTDGHGHGGDGLSNSITGTATFYAGGGGGDYRSGGYPGGDGGGAAGSGSLPSNDGTPNTGGGGGAIGGTTSYQGGSGGSGIVILRYPTSSSLNITTTGSLVYTESTDGSDTVLQFTEGSGNFGFAANNIAVGEMIFNSTTGKVEYWDGFQWNTIKDEQTPAPADPTGNGGLWAWYPLISNSNDNSGNGRNATNSGVSFTSDGGRFTGGNSISPPSGFIDFGYTHVCWVKPNHTAAGYTFSLTGYQGGYYGFTTFGFYKDTASTGFYTWQRGTNTVYWYTSNAGLSSLNSGYNLLIAQFVSGQSVKFSINGQALQTASGSGSGNPGGPYQAIRAVGKGWINGSAAVTSLDSYYRNYRIYNRTLTNTEITDIYSAGSL